MTATNTKTNNDQTPVVDVDVVSSDTNPETEAPAKDEDTTAPAADTKIERKEGEALRKQQQHQLEAALDEHGQSREDNRGYAELGPVYASQAPVANAFGAEVGFVTRDEKTNTVQRTGFGFYLRSDHICNKKYDTSSIVLP